MKNELFTLSVENYRDFKDYLNQKISIAVGAMASVETLFLCRKRCFTWTRDKFLILDKKQWVSEAISLFFFYLILLIKVGTKIAKKQQ